ncbi:MAG: aspartate carbamoyltransferase catalytic subunit [Pseudomonadota bacterium]|nr:aspartate carbamoyltransferase catalytic subunit [Pseudomonadota bacterium]
MNKKETSSLQFSPEGKLRHLLHLHGLPKNFIQGLLDQAELLQSSIGKPPLRTDTLKGRTIANLFFEPSTRTRASFELAAKRLSADVLNLDVNMSSRIKGESLLDTIYTLQAMQVDIFVVRDAGVGIPEFISRNVLPNVCVMSAGEADVSHPTQGLLDLLTIRQNKGKLDGLKVTVVGDILHSRVARSLSEGLKIMGNNELCLVAPKGLEPDMVHYPNAYCNQNIDDALEGADVIMALRIQRERIKQEPSLIVNSNEYLKLYGLTPERVALANPDAIVMHPGPMNRDVEISGSVADGPQSVITQQVNNGLAVRMAVLKSVIESHS